MDSSYGTQIIWLISGQEASKANFQNIEGEHLFIAILTFSELNEKELLTFARTQDNCKLLMEEQKALREVMEGYGIKVPEMSTALRRRLRDDMGYGKYTTQGRKKISRSEDAKKIFQRAEDYAKKIGAKTCSTIHLFRILIDIPRPLIIRALGNARLQIKPPPELTEKKIENQEKPQTPKGFSDFLSNFLKGQGKNEVFKVNPGAGLLKTSPEKDKDPSKNKKDEKKEPVKDKNEGKKSENDEKEDLFVRKEIDEDYLRNAFPPYYELNIMPQKVVDQIKMPPKQIKKSDLPKTCPRKSFFDLIGNLRELKKELMSKIFGQDQAIQTVIEGLYNAEIDASLNKDRNKPESVFVFAGPPGVGKTYMAELVANFMKRPFKRFDMTGYSDHNQVTDLVGWSPSYQAAHRGRLTGYVSDNPGAILLFDEIEKAHLVVIQLFYQILDAGRLQDKFTDKEVSFKHTIIIFTTNAGKSLYDNPNRMGISAANSNYHRRTILTALENEKNPANNNPAFPQAICSRLGQAYPVMFNHLTINEIERLCSENMKSTEELLEKSYGKKFRHDPLLPISLVFREGGAGDARLLKGESEKFIKTEIFKFISLYEKEKIEEIFDKLEEVYYKVEKNDENMAAEIQSLYETSEKPKILLISDIRLTGLYNTYISEVHWRNASSSIEALDILSSEEINLILLDLWIGGHNIGDISSDDMRRTIKPSQDFTPLSAKALNKGRDILKKLHSRFPEIPVYLLSIEKTDNKDGQKDYVPMTSVMTAGMENNDKSGLSVSHRAIDEELFLACVRAGGARGIISTDFADKSGGREWLLSRNLFAESIMEMNRRLYREKEARKLKQERKALSFETSPILMEKEKKLFIRLRNFHFTEAIDAADVGLIVDKVERPDTKFKDVMGAKGAKEALQFVINWLNKSKYYSCMGLRPPKGILLTGPPGTGKTMLARAVAGESSCAFIETSAAGFITQYQGSGVQNIKDLFTRARRYAPSIVFIDEIDAIGKTRSGNPGGSARTEESTLNALLTEMDGFSAKSSSPVIVLAATNLAEHLDPALKRRFDRIIEVDRPEKEARFDYIKKALSGRKISNVSKDIIEIIATQSAGMTIAELERILQEAAVMAVESKKQITDKILEEAFEKVRMGEAKNLPGRDSLERTARHEAGHTIITWLGGKTPFQVTIVGRGNAGGYMEREAEEDRMVYTKTDLEQRICEAMGGRAAEILYYGEEEGLSTGIAGDLKTSTMLAVRMVTQYGMDKDFGMIAPEIMNNDGPIISKIYESAEKIVKKQEERAIRLLRENKRKLDILCEKLLEKNRLSKDELELILN